MAASRSLAKLVVAVVVGDLTALARSQPGGRDPYRTIVKLSDLGAERTPAGSVAEMTSV